MLTIWDSCQKFLLGTNTNLITQFELLRQGTF